MATALACMMMATAMTGCLEGTPSTTSTVGENNAENIEAAVNNTTDPWNGSNKLPLFDYYGSIEYAFGFCAFINGMGQYVWVGVPADPNVLLPRKTKVPVGTKNLEITLDWNDTASGNGAVIDLSLGVVNPTSAQQHAKFWTPDPATPLTKPYTYVYPVAPEMTNSSKWAFQVIPDTVVPGGVAVMANYHFTVVASKE